MRLHDLRRDHFSESMLGSEIGTPAKAKTSKSFGVRPNVMWQLSPKWTMAVEGDYVLERLWRNEALARSSATSHVAGGAVYARYQLTQKLGVAARAEYLSDRGGLFSGLTQALKETTATLDYKLDDGFLMRYEWRRDFSNQRRTNPVPEPVMRRS